jgi:hypothetical protein
MQSSYTTFSKAERMGFEPTVDLNNPQLFSRQFALPIAISPKVGTEGIEPPMKPFGQSSFTDWRYLANSSHVPKLAVPTGIEPASAGLKDLWLYQFAYGTKIIV